VTIGPSYTITKETTIVPPDIKLQAWGHGPWVNEPDTVLFKYRGWHCRVRRTIYVTKASLKKLQKEHLELKKRVPDSPLLKYMPIGLGHLCGYIKMPKRHPWYDKPYDDIHAESEQLTYSSMEKDGYWIGFDFAHSGDLVPSMNVLDQVYSNLSPDLKQIQERVEKYKEKHPDTYKTIGYAMKSCENLVDEAREVKPEN